MAHNHSQIAIVGGGIGGLTTALCLEHFGLTNYHVYEQAEAFREIGAAISIWPNALRVFQKLGIYDKISQEWGVIEEAFIRSAQGKVLSKAAPKYDLPAICIHRAHLLKVLYEALPQEKLFPAHKLDEISFTSDGTVELLFENKEVATASTVIGADGINSVVRQYVIGDGLPDYRGYNVWRGIATLKDVPIGYGSETWGKGSRIGIVPIKDNKFGWWATLNEPRETIDTEGSKQKLNRLFGQWHQPIPQLFDHSPEIIKNAIGDRPPTKGWSRGNLVLMGDAAHPTTPNLGQGSCMAIEGAYLLANCLANVDNSEEAFKKYESLHFARTQEVTQQSLQTGKMGQLENQLGIRVRNLIMKLMPTSLAVRMLDKFFGFDVTQVKVN